MLVGEGLLGSVEFVAKTLRGTSSETLSLGNFPDILQASMIGYTKASLSNKALGSRTK